DTPEGSVARRDEGGDGPVDGATGRGVSPGQGRQDGGRDYLPTSVGPAAPTSRISVRSSTAAPPGSSRPAIAEISDSPFTPVDITLAALARVIPPIATAGTFRADTTSRVPSSPSGTVASALEPVANTGPTPA